MPPSDFGNQLRGYLTRVLPSSITTFQVVSDLHLEYCSQYSTFHLPAKAPYLIVAGNVGKLTDYALYLDFFASVCRSFRKVFLVLGSSENLALSRKEVRNLAERLQNEAALKGRLMVLDETKASLNAHVTLLGCTLFSNIAVEDFESISASSQVLSGRSVEDYVQLHEDQVDWLRKEIGFIRAERGSAHKILVVTSHAPIRSNQTVQKDSFSRGTSILQNDSISQRTSIFETQLLGGGGLDSEIWEQVDCWVFGANGVSMDTMYGSVRLFSNQRGMVMPFEDENTAYTRDTASLRALGTRSRKRPSEQFDVKRILQL